MRFMMMVKHPENQGPPPKEFVEEMTKLIEEAAKSGAMIISGGLAPTAKSTRVRLSRGQVTRVSTGLSPKPKKSSAVSPSLRLKSKEEAIEARAKFHGTHKKYWPGWEGETEVRQSWSGSPEEALPKEQIASRSH